MTLTRTQLALANAAIFAGVALGGATGAERFLGVVPCALCLLERWPWRIVVVLAVIGFLLPRRPARLALALAGLVVLGGGGIAALHVGVEAKLWPSPLAECAAPHAWPACRPDPPNRATRRPTSSRDCRFPPRR